MIEEKDFETFLYISKNNLQSHMTHATSGDSYQVDLCMTVENEEVDKQNTPSSVKLPV